MPRSHELVGERALTIRIAPIESAPEGPGLARLPSQDVSDFLADLEAIRLAHLLGFEERRLIGIEVEGRRHQDRRQGHRPAGRGAGHPCRAG